MEKLGWANIGYLVLAIIGACGGGMVVSFLMSPQPPGELLYLGVICGSILAMLYGLIVIAEKDLDPTRTFGQAMMNMFAVAAAGLLLLAPQFSAMSFFFAACILGMAFILSRWARKDGSEVPLVWLFFGGLPVVGIPAYGLWHLLQPKPRLAD